MGGVYCSPSMAVAARYADMKGSGTTIDNRNVTFVLQCRVNPEKIKRCHDEEGDALTCNKTPYWVLNDPADIRPYGILVKEVQKDPVTDWLAHSAVLGLVFCIF